MQKTKFPKSQLESALSASLVEAYLQTHYHVHTEKPFFLKVGQSCPELDGILLEKGLPVAAFLTAFNPFSKELTTEENQNRNRQLRLDAIAVGCECLEGIGQHPSGEWPGEASFLILGLSKERGQAFSEKYGQNAFIYYQQSKNAELILMR